jgi:NAD(P)-dependent dehydrogenase (short-subunit alcohol dehydrogenase family)
MRVALHPAGLGGLLFNLAEVSAHLVGRLSRQLAIAPDPELESLRHELRALPGLEDPGTSAVEASSMLPAPLRLRTPDGVELSFVSVLARLAAELDAAVIPCDLADPAAAAALVARAGEIELLIANAGIDAAEDLLDLGHEEIARAVAVNLTAQAVLAAGFARGMSRRATATSC